MRKSLSLLAEILKREWESALPCLGIGGGEQERDHQPGMTAAPLSLPAGQNAPSYTDGICVWDACYSWGQQEQRGAWKTTRSILQPELFRCRVTSDTNLHLSYKMPKEYCKPAKASVKIPPPGTQSESKRWIKCAWKSLEHTRTW